MEPVRDGKVNKASSQQELNSLGFYRPQTSRIPTPRNAISQSSARDLTTGASRGKTSERGVRSGTDMSVWSQQLRTVGHASVRRRSPAKLSRTTQTEHSDSDTLKHPVYSDTCMTFMWKDYGECPKIFTLRESSSGTLAPPGGEVERNVIDGQRNLLKAGLMVSAVVQTDNYDHILDTSSGRCKRDEGPSQKNSFKETFNGEEEKSEKLMMFDRGRIEAQPAEDKERKTIMMYNFTNDESGVESEIVGYLSERGTVEDENEGCETFTLVNRPAGEYQNEGREALTFFDQPVGGEVEYEDLDTYTLVNHCDGEMVDYEIEDLGRLANQCQGEFVEPGSEEVESLTFINQSEGGIDEHYSKDLRNQSNSVRKRRENKVNFRVDGSSVKSILDQIKEGSISHSWCSAMARKMVRFARRLVISVILTCLLVLTLSSLASYGYCVATFYPVLIPVPSPPPRNLFLQWLSTIIEAPAVLRLGVNWENIIHGMSNCINPTVLCPWPFCDVFNEVKNGRKIWSSYGTVGRLIKEPTQ